MTNQKIIAEYDEALLDFNSPPHKGRPEKTQIYEEALLLKARAELLRRLDEGDRAQENLAILCYIALEKAIISRGKACEVLGINRADLDNKLSETQLVMAKRNIDLLEAWGE